MPTCCAAQALRAAWLGAPVPQECPASLSLSADTGLKGQGLPPPGGFQDRAETPPAPRPGLTVAFSCSEAAPSQRRRTMLLGRGRSRPGDSPGTARGRRAPERAAGSADRVPRALDTVALTATLRQDPAGAAAAQGTRLCPAPSPASCAAPRISAPCCV